MQVPTIVLCALSLVTAPPAPSRGPTVTLPHCLVSLIEEAQVPAQELGVLVALKVREGQQVSAGDLLGQIDDTHAQMQLAVAKYKLQVAKEEAENDIHVRYSTAAAAVAEAEYRLNTEANRKVPGTVPQIEIRRLLLTHRRTVLEIEQAQVNLRIAALEAKVSQAELDAAEVNLQRRHIKAPLDGVVVELHRHEGEWVQPGDPVLHIVRVDRLRIEGFLNAADVAPGQLGGQPVKVGVKLARNRQATFDGRVVFVSPLVQAGGDFQVWAEVSNRQENGQWLLRPGLPAKMTIRLSSQ